MCIYIVGVHMYCMYIYVYLKEKVKPLSNSEKSDIRKQINWFNVEYCCS